jgi:hypothetical protein
MSFFVFASSFDRVIGEANDVIFDFCTNLVAEAEGKEEPTCSHNGYLLSGTHGHLDRSQFPRRQFKLRLTCRIASRIESLSSHMHSSGAPEDYGGK